MKKYCIDCDERVEMKLENRPNVYTLPDGKNTIIYSNWWVCPKCGGGDIDLEEAKRIDKIYEARCGGTPAGKFSGVDVLVGTIREAAENNKDNSVGRFSSYLMQIAKECNLV